MKFIKTAAIAAAILAACINSGSAQTLSEIMERHEKAIGGVENWNKLKTAKMEGSMIINGLELNMTQTLILGMAMRADISFMGMSGFTVVTNTGGWTYMPFSGSTTVDTLNAATTKMLRDRANIKSVQLLDYKENGTKLDLAGRDTINNVPCYKLKRTNKDGETMFCYIDAATYYVTRIDGTLKIEDQEQNVSTVFANYQKLPEGIVMPTSVTSMGTEVVYKSVEFNKPVDERIFIPSVEK